MQKEYQTPLLKLVEMTAEDVVRTSGTFDVESVTKDHVANFLDAWK